MESTGKNSGLVKTPQKNQSKISTVSKDGENSNPNFSSPSTKLSKSAAPKSGKKPQKSGHKNLNAVASPSPQNKIRERKFVVAKKNLKREKSKSLCKCKISCNLEKCPSVAYEILRVSQDEFFKNRDIIDNCSDKSAENVDDCSIKNGMCENEVTSEVVGSMNVKRSIDQVLNNVPKPGSGKVMNLVKAFEQLLTSKESDDNDKGTGLVALRTEDPVVVSSSSFCPSDFYVTSESLGLDRRVFSSLSSSQGSFTLSSRNSGGGRGSRRNSFESSGSFGGRQRRKRHHRVTSQRPFNLRTELRGRSKEEEFIKKVQERMMEEEKQRIPVAQGLPWTTDEPECLVKPPVKESTRPCDLVLHSDVRAVERADFDHQVAEKMSYIEQFKMERERQQKLAEEEEIRRLRRTELIPIAQPMPYFDRPFIPRRSLKDPTIPKEPKFHHLPQHKKIKHYKSRSAVE